MSRRALLPTPRLATALVAGAVMITSALTGAAAAHATTSVTDNEATVLRIGGATLSGATSIPAGRTLTPVRLSTSDPATTVADGTSLTGPVPEVRTKRFVIPAVPAEQVTFRIDGVTVATSVPELRATFVETDAGRVPGVLFTAGGTSYVIPRGPVAGVTRVVASSTVNTSTVSVTTYQYGLLPVGVQPRTGTTFRQSTSGTSVTGTGTARYTVYDADAVRENADAPGEELVVLGAPPSIYASRLDTGTEVLATVTLGSGATTTVRGVRYRIEQSYGLGETIWALDRAALAAAGGTITDVTDVVSFAPTEHDLTWQDLGFDLT